MSWQQIKLQTNAEFSESLESLLMEFGAVSISFLDAKDQPVFQIEPGSTVIWDSTILIALFEATFDLTSCLEILESHQGVLNSEKIQIEELEDQNWERAWMDDFKAMQFGKRLWICPSWQRPPDPKAVNIMLDPGLAFGSGTHATTALCLEWLEQAELEDKRVIDYGCGSGILAIAASLLGAKHVIAIDNDPQAITATVDNSARNNVHPSSLEAMLPDQHEPKESDIVLANILAAPLIELSDSLAMLVRHGGSIVLSGILVEQATSVSEAYERFFDLRSPVINNGWVRIEGTKK